MSRTMRLRWSIQSLCLRWGSHETAFCWTNLDLHGPSDVPAETPLNTTDVVKQGLGVLDGGATRTMGSLVALQHIQDACQKANQPGFVRVDTTERPVFGFGISQKDQCASTCYLRLPVEEQAMSLKVHALDKGHAPVLISVDSMRRMGAIVDFRRDEAVFTAINPKKLVKLQRSSAGHQLIPLTSDFMTGGEEFSNAVNSLRQVFQE